MSSYICLDNTCTLLPLHFLALNPGLHTPNDIQFDSTVQKRYNPTTSTSLIGDVEELSQQANAPKQLRQTMQQTKQGQEERGVTHLPYRSIETHGGSDGTAKTLFTFVSIVSRQLQVWGSGSFKVQT
eukprot:3534231-Amphidinium_carterae.1